MKSKQLLSFGLGLVAVSSYLSGAEIFPLTKPGEIAEISEESARAWRLPVVRPRRGRVLLSWEARIASRRAGGFREFMQVSINGRTVGPRADRLTLRLVNKPDHFYRSNGEIRFWYRHEARGWIVVFAPDFESANKQTRYRFGGHAYDFVIDITDLLDTETTNSLEIRNLTTHQYVRKWRRGRPATLFVRNLRLVTDEHPPVVRRSAATPSARAKLESVGLRVFDGGGFALVVNGREHRFDTRVSFPHGGWNRIAAQDTAVGDEPDWQVNAERGRAAAVRAKGKFYEITRTLRLEGRRLDIEDRFENADEKSKLGLLVSHGLLCSQEMPRRVWMGGSDNPSLNDVGCPQNPTLFVPTRGLGLGVVLQDDVFRLQGKCSYDASSRKIGVYTDTFALDAGAAYTMRWSIYVVASNDYFDFINLVRADWGVNTTIHGPYAWMKAGGIAAMSPEKLRERLQASQLKYLCIWSNPSSKRVKGRPYVALGAGPFSPEADQVRGGHVQKMKDAVRRVHEAGVDTKVLLMTNCFKNSVIEDVDVAAFEGSWYRNRAGKLKRYSAVPDMFPTYHICPTQRNSWGKRFAEVLDFLATECGADGIYWDEMSACSGDMRTTYGEWDGHSAEIDPETKTIKRLLGLVPLMSASYCRAQIDRLHAQGKFVHANGASGVRALQTALDSRMVETKFVPIRVREVHLITPLAYTYGTPGVKKIRERLMRGGLCFRSQYHTAHPVMTRLFPFTPMELHGGWIKAEERIITCVSGRFGWEGKFAARVWRFDAKTSVLNLKPIARNYEGAAVAVDVPADGLAIVERVFE